jgi:STE24 endopeptidase
MTALLWTSLFAAALVASLTMRAWLATRQVRHVARHRHEVPLPFRASVDLAAPQRAGDYTLAKARLDALRRPRRAQRRRARGGRAALRRARL